MRTIFILFSIFIFSIVKNINAQVVPGSVIEENIDTFLSTPAANYIKEIPVLVVRYLPTTDGINIDVSQATGYWAIDSITINNLKTNINNYDKRVKFSLEEGSKYHGYKDTNAIPYLGYKVLKYITVYRQISVSNNWVNTEGGKYCYQPDYNKEFNDLNLTTFIKENNVKEVWLWYGEAARPNWPSYDSTIHGNIQEYVSFVESNMSSPTTGDISNSYRYEDDLPILDSTYMVYCQNFRRSQAEAVHNHGHQLESIYKYTAYRQDGDVALFVQNFSGWGDNNYTVPPLGRAGDCHHPPNTTVDYDYLNTTLVPSDIEDWNPYGGTTKSVNVNTWGNLIYKWPGASDFSQRRESQWYIYWFQNMPGYNNNIPYDLNDMTNWWQFTSNWDYCYNNNIGLYGPHSGLQENSKKMDNVYPNPTDDKIIINLNSQSAIAYIYSIENKLLKTELLNNTVNEINVDDFKSGIYILKLQTDKEIIVKKIIKK